jgi:hypothetical protein
MVTAVLETTAVTYMVCAVAVVTPAIKFVFTIVYALFCQVLVVIFKGDT